MTTLFKNNDNAILNSYLKSAKAIDKLLSFNEEELMELIRAGCHEAFSLLVKRNTNTFYRVAYRYLGNKNTAEDIVQQAFLKLWEFPYKYNAKDASFKTWFYRVVINLCIDYQRKNKRVSMFDVSGYELEDNKESAEDNIANKQEQVLLEQAVNSLPIRQQTAINLGFYEQMPYKEVAHIMKVNTSAVQSLIMRAKENIKKFIVDDGEKNVK